MGDMADSFELAWFEIETPSDNAELTLLKLQQHFPYASHVIDRRQDGQSEDACQN